MNECVDIPASEEGRASWIMRWHMTGGRQEKVLEGVQLTGFRETADDPISLVCKLLNKWKAESLQTISSLKDTVKWLQHLSERLIRSVKIILCANTWNG